mgnify:CR=1 FL=1
MRWMDCAIVDDNKFDLFICDRILERLVPTLPKKEFQTGREILDFVQSDDYSGNNMLVLLDLNMPEMNGHDFLKELTKLPKKKTEHLDVVIVTSSSLREDKERSEASSFVKAYMSKPILLSSLEEILNGLESTG